MDHAELEYMCFHSCIRLLCGPMDTVEHAYFYATHSNATYQDQNQGRQAAVQGGGGE